MSTAKMYWLHALTPLHVGVGRGVGFIDLPIMREKVTNWPLIPGSAVKGVLRDNFETHGSGQQKTLLPQAFGRPDQDNEAANSGSLVFTDARLICLPIRSLYGTFAWVTSPLVLHRLLRDLEISQTGGLPGIPQQVPAAGLLLPEGGASALTDLEGKTVYFEDLDFEVRQDPLAQAWAEKLATWVFPDDTSWQDTFKKRFAIIPDASFDFLSETGTEVAARVKIDPDKKTVTGGSLWYEESLPAETILAGMVWCDRVFPKKDESISQQDLFEGFCSAPLQIQVGGKATVGKGQVRCLFANGGKANG